MWCDVFMCVCDTVRVSLAVFSSQKQKHRSYVLSYYCRTVYIMSIRLRDYRVIRDVSVVLSTESVLNTKQSKNLLHLSSLSLSIQIRRWYDNGKLEQFFPNFSFRMWCQSTMSHPVPYTQKRLIHMARSYRCRMCIFFGSLLLLGPPHKPIYSLYTRTGSMLINGGAWMGENGRKCERVWTTTTITKSIHKSVYICTTQVYIQWSQHQKCGSNGCESKYSHENPNKVQLCRWLLYIFCIKWVNGENVCACRVFASTIKLYNVLYIPKYIDLMLFGI